MDGGRVDESRLIFERAELPGGLGVRPRSTPPGRLGGKSLTQEAVDIGALGWVSLIRGV